MVACNKEKPCGNNHTNVLQRQGAFWDDLLIVNANFSNGYGEVYEFSNFDSPPTVDTNTILINQYSRDILDNPLEYFELAPCSNLVVSRTDFTMHSARPGVHVTIGVYSESLDYEEIPELFVRCTIDSVSDSGHFHIEYPYRARWYFSHNTPRLGIRLSPDSGIVGLMLKNHIKLVRHD